MRNNLDDEDDDSLEGAPQRTVPPSYSRPDFQKTNPLFDDAAVAASKETLRQVGNGLVNGARKVSGEIQKRPQVRGAFGKYWSVGLGAVLCVGILHNRFSTSAPTDDTLYTAIAQAENINSKVQPFYDAATLHSVPGPDLSQVDLGVADIRLGSCHRQMTGGDAKSYGADLYQWSCSFTYTRANKTNPAERESASQTVSVIRAVGDAGIGTTSCVKCGRALMFKDSGVDLNDQLDDKQITHLPLLANGGAL